MLTREFAVLKAVVEQKHFGSKVFFHLAPDRIALDADADMSGTLVQKHLRLIAG